MSAAARIGLQYRIPAAEVKTMVSAKPDHRPMNTEAQDVEQKAAPLQKRQ